MKHLLARIFCRIAGIAIMALGAWPLVRGIQKRAPDAHLSYNDITYSDYNSVLSILILLAAVAIGILLLWVGNRIKTKRSSK